jgi:tRNA threonylcarbamoyladenosine biosynthesis protein TsaB
MTILCIETSTSCCSVAICIDGIAVANKENLVGANHASELPVFVEQLLAESAANKWHIDAVALSQGPGSYTGLRIGTSVAKGLCYGMNIPLIPVNTLQILCASIPPRLLTSSSPHSLCPMLDARRMEVYTAMYHSKTLQQTTDIIAKVIDAQSFAEELSEQDVYFFGNGAEKCQSVITSPNAHFIANIHPQAQYMGKLAETATSLDVKQMAYYEPFYLKDFVPAPSHIKGLN